MGDSIGVYYVGRAKGHAGQKQAEAGTIRISHHTPACEAGPFQLAVICS